MLTNAFDTSSNNCFLLLLFFNNFCFFFCCFNCESSSSSSASDDDEEEEEPASLELELDESEDEDLEEGEELDLEESDDDAEEDEDKLDEYVTPVSASAGDNGDNTSTTVNANPKRPGDDSNAAPVKTNDGNTSGGKGDAPKDMATGNVNVSGNAKAPAMKGEKAAPGDNGA